MLVAEEVQPLSIRVNLSILSGFEITLSSDICTDPTSNLVLELVLLASLCKAWYTMGNALAREFCKS